MKIPTNASMKDFQSAPLRSLLVGRFSGDQPNFFAIRSEINNSGSQTPYIVILNASVGNKERPYISDNDVKVFDLEADWLIDVAINSDEPSQPARFGSRDDDILVRSGVDFFLRLNDPYYLDMTNGNLVSSLPDNDNIAAWAGFTIYLPQPNEPGPGAEVFTWPE